MADDEPEVPARPPSRGPRVVTGDMLRAKAKGPRVATGPSVTPPGSSPPAAGDGPAETLVGPGAPPPPPHDDPPGEPRRRVVLGRTAATSGPASGERQAAPPWSPPPTGAGPVVPPPVHRSATSSPSSRPTATSGSPPSSYKAPRPPSGGRPGEPLAPIALGLALVSIVSAGILAIPALILAARAKRRLAERPGAGGAGLVTAARVVALLSLAGWLVVAGIAIADRVRPDGVDYATLKAGDCIDTPEGTEVRRLRVRACDEPHDAEVFAVVTHPAAPGEAFPGADALLQYAATECLGQPFTDYVGIPRGQSQLTEFEIVPERQAWAEGRRGLVCAVDNADRSPMTGSVRGSAR
jgi:Septum formation